MNHASSGSSDLDGIFAAFRACVEALDASRRWVVRAERTGSPVWRLSFLHEARRVYERASTCLAVVSTKLAAFGSEIPPPLDRVGYNLGLMRAALATHDEKLRALEAQEGKGAKATPNG